MYPSTIPKDTQPRGRLSQRTCNIASHLPRMAKLVPDQPAVVVTQARKAGGKALYKMLTFAELETLSNRYANGLASVGFDREMRTLVMVRPGIEFICLAFALFKLGVAPVMIDPGMGISRMLECIRSVEVQGFIGIPAAHVIRILRPGSFRSVKRIVTVGRRWIWGGSSLDEISGSASPTFTMEETRPDETAAILFTSGSTGPAKGVVYEHGMFDAQVSAIQACYRMQPGEVDLPTFPLFALFSTAMGMTSVIPDMDPSKPAQVDPARIVEAVQDHAVTTTFGSPAIWARVASYCVQHDLELPSLRRILVAGAPVSHGVISRLHKILHQDADVHTPYGATESLPVSSICGREIVADCAELSKRGGGTCVGRPLDGIDLRIIRVTDEPIPAWTDDLEVPEGQIGEITVAGSVVTKKYFGLTAATAAAKITDADRVWHRIGDLGYLDAGGRIWFCGRKAHRVFTENGTLYSVCCEAVFNEHPHVLRTALVGVASGAPQRPVIVVQPEPGNFPGRNRIARFRAELNEIAKSHEHTRHIEDFLFHPALPVDVRHNAKINREALSEWASRRIR